MCRPLAAWHLRPIASCDQLVSEADQAVIKLVASQFSSSAGFDRRWLPQLPRRLP